MGMYINTGNERFKSDIESEIYVDKTGLIGILNQKIGTNKRYIAVSRARRFGKSMAANMLQAYYCYACDSSEMFSGFEIAQPDKYRENKKYFEHLNKYNVLMIDMGSFISSAAETGESSLDNMFRRVKSDMQNSFPKLFKEAPMSIAEGMQAIYQSSDRRFVVIIDEWDCIIRENPLNSQIVKDYIQFLRSLFKTNESRDYVALAYMTGILPIKLFEGESVLNDFEEYTMIYPFQLDKYFGFTEEEVQSLAKRYDMDSAELNQWYDGYIMNGKHMYNPNSLVGALTKRHLKSYWTNTSSFKTISRFIEMDYDGLRDDAIKLLSGEKERIKVNVNGFKNDLNDINSRNDCITALIHLGYLGYDMDTKEAFIPNLEVSEAFELALSTGKWKDIGDALEKSDSLLEATLRGDEMEVARLIQQSRMDYSSIIAFNDENALASAVVIAYYTARRDYIMIRELPSGRGYADIAFLPRKNSEKPPMIVELKWDKSADSALKQIEDKCYEGKLMEYSGNILLVGINYDKKGEEISCVIKKKDEIR